MIDGSEIRTSKEFGELLSQLGFESIPVELNHREYRGHYCRLIMPGGKRNVANPILVSYQTDGRFHRAFLDEFWLEYVDVDDFAGVISEEDFCTAIKLGSKRINQDK